MSNIPLGDPDNNSVLYTCGHYFSILKKRGELDLVKDRAHFLDLYDAIKVGPGRYNRGENKLQHNAFDDIIGLARGAQLLAPEVALEIYTHGLNNDWLYNNTDKKDILTLLSSWHWRIAGTTQHYKICADKILTPFDRFAFGVDKTSTGFKPWSATSGRLLDWIKIESYYDTMYKNERCDEVARNFEASISNKYDNGISDVFGKYFSKAHPFSIFTINIGNKMQKGA